MIFIFLNNSFKTEFKLTFGVARGVGGGCRPAGGAVLGLALALVDGRRRPRGQHLLVRQPPLHFVAQAGALQRAAQVRLDVRVGDAHLADALAACDADVVIDGAFALPQTQVRRRLHLQRVATALVRRRRLLHSTQTRRINYHSSCKGIFVNAKTRQSWLYQFSIIQQRVEILTFFKYFYIK